MAKKVKFLGSVSLVKDKNGKGLVSETIVHPKTGKKGIFIPVDDNPSIYVKVREDGKKTINLDIEIVETPNNTYGNSHLIKLNIGRENRQKLGNLSREQQDQLTPIVGNIRRFEFETQDNNGVGQQGGYQGEDMPAEFSDTW